MPTYESQYTTREIWVEVTNNLQTIMIQKLFIFGSLKVS